MWFKIVAVKWTECQNFDEILWTKSAASVFMRIRLPSGLHLLYSSSRNCIHLYIFWMHSRIIHFEHILGLKSWRFRTSKTFPCRKSFNFQTMSCKIRPRILQLMSWPARVLQEPSESARNVWSARILQVCLISKILARFLQIGCNHHLASTCLNLWKFRPRD